MTTRKDNGVTNHIDVVYSENETELSWPIGPGAVNDKTNHQKTWEVMKS